MQQLEGVVLGQHGLVLRMDALGQAGAAGAALEFLAGLATIIVLEGQETYLGLGSAASLRTESFEVGF